MKVMEMDSRFRGNDGAGGEGVTASTLPSFLHARGNDGAGSEGVTKAGGTSASVGTHRSQPLADAVQVREPARGRAAPRGS